jgi:cytochrome c peroxidase
MHTRLFIAILILSALFTGASYQQKGTTPYMFSGLEYFPPMPINADNPTTFEGVALGRKLFFDKRLSADNTISCASCHKPEYAFSDGGNKLSKGLRGNLMKRNTPPIFNMAWYGGYFWDGRAPDLESQVFEPLNHPDEMALGGALASRRIAADTHYQILFPYL